MSICSAMADQQQQIIQQMSGLPDLSSAIKLSESRDVIEFILKDYCGLRIVQMNNKDVLVREGRPLFTFDFAKDLSNNIYTEVNRISARTDFTKDQLQKIMFIGARAMSEWFGIRGVESLVSPKAWKIATSLLEPDKTNPVLDKKGKPIKDQDQNEIYYNKFYTKFKMIWNYDEPFTQEMLDAVKVGFDLDEERFGQDVILRPVFLAVRTFIEGGLNRSKDHLTLDYEKVIHKETFGATAQEQAVAQQEEKVSGIRQKITNFFNGNKRQ